MSFTHCPLVLVGLLEDHPRVEGGVGARRVVRGRERGRALVVVGPRDAEVELLGEPRRRSRDDLVDLAKLPCTRSPSTACR